MRHHVDHEISADTITRAAEQRLPDLLERFGDAPERLVTEAFLAGVRFAAVEVTAQLIEGGVDAFLHVHELDADRDEDPR